VQKFVLLKYDMRLCRELGSEKVLRDVRKRAAFLNVRSNCGQRGGEGHERLIWVTTWIERGWGGENLQRKDLGWEQTKLTLPHKKGKKERINVESLGWGGVRTWVYFAKVVGRGKGDLAGRNKGES